MKLLFCVFFAIIPYIQFRFLFNFGCIADNRNIVSVITTFAHPQLVCGNIDVHFRLLAFEYVRLVASTVDIGPKNRPMAISKFRVREGMFCCSESLEEIRIISFFVKRNYLAVGRQRWRTEPTNRCGKQCPIPN